MKLINTINCVYKFLIFLFIFVFFGCKTVPVGNQVDPLDLLDNTSSFYIAIPTKADPELVQKIIQNNIDGLSEQDSISLAQRIDVVYCGLTRTRKTSELQAAIGADIPSNLVPKICSKKNGWSNREITPQGATKPYTVYSYDNLDISFPDSRIACLGRGQDYMLSNYDQIANAEEVKINNSELDPLMYNYLKAADTDIRFYANKPQSFLTILTGANLDLKLIDVCGSFVCDPKRETQYILELNFRFRNEKYLKAGRTLLSMAFGLANGEAENIVGNELKISNIKLNKDQLMKILVIK